MKKAISNILSKFPFLYAIILNTFRGDYGFQGNIEAREAVSDIMDEYPITSFVETGTHRGDTAYFMAKRYPYLWIYTCEINPTFYQAAKRRLAGCKNVNVMEEDSKAFLETYPGFFGELPLFFLDAHDKKENPLLGELKIINQNFKKAIILIDDVGDINQLKEIEPFFDNYETHGKYLISFKGIK